MSIRSFGPAILLAMLAISCSEPPPAAPMCRVDTAQHENLSANAGCLIRMDDRLLVIGHKRSGKLDIPGGTSDGQESARCTAHRETWEETGFNVQVGAFLGQNTSGFRYYACSLNESFGAEWNKLPVPAWAQSEVDSIQLVDPFALTDDQWRFSDRLTKLRAMFNRTPKSQ